MKRCISIICGLLLITHAIVAPINAIASQSVEGVVKEEESTKGDELSLEGESTEQEDAMKDENTDLEDNATKEESTDLEDNVTKEESTDLEDDTSKEEAGEVEEDTTEEENINEEGEITEVTEEDFFEGIEMERFVYGSTIQIDGTYSDWKHIPHTDISWYSPDPEKVHQGALYLEDDIVYGHFKMNDAYKTQMIVAYMELTINNDTNVGLTIQKATPDGNIDWNFDMYNLPDGTTTGLGVFYNDYPKYYMGEASFTVYESNHLIGDEVEFAIDLNVISKITNIPIESMREIKLYNPNIGSDAIIIAGSSSGAVMGVIIMTVIAAGGLLYLKRRKVTTKM